MNAAIEAARAGALTLEKLEAMTSVCSVGLDMIAIPGDTSAETLSGIIADEMAVDERCGVLQHIHIGGVESHDAFQIVGCCVILIFGNMDGVLVIVVTDKVFEFFVYVFFQLLGKLF